ncbi:MAG TPA: carbohydrate porin [Steroidobacteraceae bacterium]
MAPRREARALLLTGAMAFVLPGIALAQSVADDWRHRTALTGDPGGIRSNARESGLTFNASYQGEVAANLSGGNQHTARYTQQVELEALLDMGRIADIDDARLQVTLNYREGRSLTKEVLHNQFSVQELYSYPSSQILRLSQFNWLQNFADRRVTVQIGWSPVGNAFARLPDFCKFQSFVICGHSNAMTVNSGSINGPVSQWGARIKAWPTEHFYVNAGAYRNNIDGGTDGGFDLSLDNDGTFYPIELGWEWREGVPRGSIAFGAYYNTANTSDAYYDVNRDPAGLTGLPFLQHGGRHGGYVMGQQVIYQPEPGNAARTLSILGIGGVGDSATARFRRFAIAGAIYQGPFSNRPDDFVSFMVAWAATNPRLSQYQRDRNQMLPDSASAQRWEAVIELDCGIQATPWLLLQPNLQYIVQPGGNDDRGNALVLGLHFALKL